MEQVDHSPVTNAPITPFFMLKRVFYHWFFTLKQLIYESCMGLNRSFFYSKGRVHKIRFRLVDVESISLQ